MNWAMPPASLVMLAFAWPALSFLNACGWLYNTYHGENMEDKVVIITGASSGIGEQIAYEYAKRRANLVWVARREFRLVGITCPDLAADVKEEDCRRFVNETISLQGHLDHLVNTASLGHTFYFEEVTDTSVFPHLMDITFWGNVYATFVALPYLHQSNGKIVVNRWRSGITIATHGWIGSEMTRGKFMLEEGAEMQWKEEREVHVSGGPVEEFAELIVSGACRGEPYVKYPSWYDTFLLFRVFAPNVLRWTFRLLLATHGARRTSLVGTRRPIWEGAGRPLLEGPSPRKLIASPVTLSQLNRQYQQKNGMN
ncbi:hypothetical protein NL676_028137 [Syzygium grande]|nr:hypothetical protein NL676_028137 [Syzygium grande]